MLAHLASAAVVSLARSSEHEGKLLASRLVAGTWDDDATKRKLAHPPLHVPVVK